MKEYKNKDPVTQDFIKRVMSIHGTKFDMAKTVYKNRRTPVIFECPVHGEKKVMPPILLRKGGYGCGKCGKEIARQKRKASKLTTEEFKTKVLEKSTHNLNLDKVVYKGNKKHIIVTCKQHGDFKILPSNLLSGQNCPKCSREKNKISTTDYFNRVKEIHDNYYDYTKSKYTGLYDKFIITCPEHGEFQQTPADHLYSKSKCPECAEISRRKNKSYNTKSVIEMFKSRHGNKYDYSKVNYTGHDKPVAIICPEHGAFKQRPETHASGAGCIKCSGKYQLTKKEWFAKAKTIHGDLYGYEKTIYPPSIEDRGMVTITCKKHSDVRVRARAHVSDRVASGCPKCSSSLGEQITGRVLERHGLTYTKEYTIPSAYFSKYRYDFYVNKLNILIEYDGEAHYFPIKHFGGEKSYEAIVKRDREKTQMAIEHGYYLIRIPYKKLNNIEDFLLFKISKIYKYRVNDKFYKTFMDLCRGEHLPDRTMSKDVEQYLLYKK